MRKSNKLTTVSIRAASEPGLYGDGHGLYLQVSSFGTKSWLFRYMIDGVPRKMGLGALHTVSLAEARKRAAQARLQVHDRLDPIDQRKASRGDARLAAATRVSPRRGRSRSRNARIATSKRIGTAGATRNTLISGTRRSMRPGAASGSFRPRRPR